MESGTIAIIAAAVGGLIGLAGAFAVELCKYLFRQRNLRGAYAAEIRALLNLMGEVRLLENLKETITQMKATKAPRVVPNTIAENYRMVFSATASQLGTLGVLSERIIKFYYQVGSIIEDYRASNAAYEGHGAQYLLNYDDCLKFHETLLEKISRAQDLACDLINELERAPR